MEEPESRQDELDKVFKALNDPSRRLLLDRLRETDGQTLGELCTHLPAMTRYGVMNHLRVLAEAHLVTTTTVGRHKHHYLNPVPIRLIHDRWISNFTEPMVDGLIALRQTAGVNHHHNDPDDHDDRQDDHLSR